MIEINLLPGSGKKKKSGGGGAKFDLAASLAGLSSKVKDKYLATAFLLLFVGGGAVGGTYTLQSKQESDLSSSLEIAVKDSEHFASVLREKQRAESKRDTVLRQLNIIRSIDEDRFVWPHILDEVSKALPPYTWLTVVNYTGAPQGALNIATGPGQKPPVPGALPGAAPPDSAPKKKTKHVETEIPKDTVKVRLLGRTVDIQALTRFMKQLEASPFLTDVQLQKSELAIDEKKEVTQFTLDVTYTRPDTSLLRRVPLAVSVR
jgi:Tfp pilus assembly protein PilN